MSDDAHQTAEWYYVGHYGQLGPLTLEQITDLAVDGVIDRDTFVWRPGMDDWLKASSVPEIMQEIGQYLTTATGPVGLVLPPTFDPARAEPAPPVFKGFEELTPTAPPQSTYSPTVSPTWHPTYANVPVSDKSRMTAAVLCLIPGAGRFYLGYAAHGTLQIITSMCALGIFWSWLDGLYMLAGGVKYDGYGRVLKD